MATASPELDIFNFRLQSAQRNLDAMASLMGDLARRNDHLRGLRQELAFESSMIGKRLLLLKSQVEAIKKSLDEIGNPLEAPGIPQVATNAAYMIATIDDLNILILNARKKWKEVSIPELYPSDVAPSGDEFDKKIKDSRDKLEELEMMGQEALVKPWSDLKGLERFWTDYLDYVAGLSLRHEGLDNGICDIADAMIRELRRYSDALSALAIPGRDSTFASPPKTVYLRFPEWTVWSLPLAAHELWLMADSGGAAIAKNFYTKASQHLREGESSPFILWTELINPAKLARRPRKDLVIYLADAFATFTLGPAYAWSALLLDLDPTEEMDNFRALTILHTLARLNDSDETRPLEAELQQLGQIWQDAVLQAGRESLPLRKGLAEWADALLVKLKSDQPALGFPIATWSAERVRDPWVHYFLDGSQQQPAIAGHDIRFAINAAWKARTEQPASATDIANRCLELCKTMAKRPTAPEPWSKGAPGAWMSVS